MNALQSESNNVYCFKAYALTPSSIYRVYTRALVYTKERMIRDPNLPSEQIYTPVFRRGIFTVGLLMRFFDFSRVDVNGSNTNERSKNIIFWQSII